MSSLTWHDRLLASLTRYLPESKDGWEWMLDDVRLMLEGAQEPPDWPASIGELTGRLHAAAARATSVIPRPVGRSDLIPLGRHYRRLLQTELDPEMTQALAPWRDRMERACTVVESATDVEVIPLHGDLHPGQFLLWREGIANLCKSMLQCLQASKLLGGCIEGDTDYRVHIGSNSSLSYMNI